MTHKPGPCLWELTVQLGAFSTGGENSVMKGLYGGGERHGGSGAEFCESEPAHQARGAERRGGWGKESQARRGERRPG